jgi:VIT1/CCC1 family predicted Fe2+/Mn2+ transporter
VPGAGRLEQVGGRDVELEESFCRDEYKDYVIYRFLAERESDPERRRILEAMAEQELGHYEFWKSRLGRDCREGVSKLGLYAVLLSRKILGLTFTVKLLERHENEVIDAYKRYLERLEGEDRRRLEEIIRDEEQHEKNLLSQVNERIVRYLGFIALGLADAIVEITGVHAGFLGATATTLVAGVAGLIVGLSAAISMSAAAYIQAKHEASESPVWSAAATGIAYFIAVVLLALPYFVTHSNVLAFLASVALAVVLVAFFTFYSSVINETSFRRDLAESLAVLFGTAAAAYIFGDLLGSIFGLQEITWFHP